MGWVDLSLTYSTEIGSKPDELGGKLLDLVLLHACVLLQGTVLLQNPQEP